VNPASGSPVKPKRIGPGSLLGIVSPASTPKPELVAAGRAALEALGYRTRLFAHALDRGPLYYAGRLEDRLADLHAAFADPEIDAILCTRGGWGSAELLPHLDSALIAAHPKAFLGYSDLTSLHLWLRQRANLVTFHAPMVAADFAKPDGADRASWRAALEHGGAWSLGLESGLRLLRAAHSGSAAPQGELSGGCLSIYAEALGTPFAPAPRDCVLFFEDIGVKPYQWDRMLLHCRYAGLFAGATAIVFGDMAQSCAVEELPLLEAALLHNLRDFAGPLLIGLRSGHVASQNLTLPLGVQVSLEVDDPANPRIHLLEAAVSG
jgi:muramoyltetrapeptide carboxypeptidase